MKNQLLFLGLFALWSGCQPNDSSLFGVDPQLTTYSDEAPMTQKLFCNSLNCENPWLQELYTYNPTGRLTRIDQLSRAASGKLELWAYTDYRYTQNGQLSGWIRYGKQSNGNGWVASNESEYVYTNTVLSVERTYFNQHNPDLRVLTGQIDYAFRDGKKVGQTWYDAQHTVGYRVAYAYTNNTLTGETWFDATDTPLRRFEHQFSGNSRQISEYMPKSAGRISMVEKTYDGQGRLASEETKVINPLLCTMQAGIIRYVY